MDLRFTDEETAFRKEVRSFVDENLPKDIRDRLGDGFPPRKADTVLWQRILNAKGWAVPGWPKEHGGTGWNAAKRYILLEEILEAPAPEPLSFNVNMVGPVIIAFGSPAQKARFLPRIRNLDDWWCQGFSEPGSGSDLASLRTAARRDGDHYVVNGQKIWTSTAHQADWIFALVRTNPDAGKQQEGISYLLIDMKTPGITVRPIISIDGSHHLNEVFFDEVRVPVENRVGDENKGWTYAKFLLGNERTGIARVGKSRERIRRVKELAQGVETDEGKLAESGRFRERLALAEIELKALEITQMRVVAQSGKRTTQDPFSSILKISGSTLQQSATEFMLEVGGPETLEQHIEQAAGDNAGRSPDWADMAAAQYFFLRAASIYGGSNEIQRNILSKAVLGL